MFKFGYVGIIGLPNAGKSTLLNEIIGEHIAIVSRKAQTTRKKILGIKSDKDYQVVFIDTPGFHYAKNKNALSKVMLQEVTSVFNEVDAVYFVIDAHQKFTVEFLSIIEHINVLEVPLFILINKIDSTKREKVYMLAEQLNEKVKNHSIVPISAKNGVNIEKLLELTEDVLPEGRKYYSEEDITTQSREYLISEFVREAIFNNIHQEIPYGIAVVTENLVKKRNTYNAEIKIIVKLDRHKGILIGKKGASLKAIGIEARKQAEQFFGIDFYLDLHVKVIKDWDSKAGVLESII